MQNLNEFAKNSCENTEIAKKNYFKVLFFSAPIFNFTLLLLDKCYGAASGNRTYDLFITNEVHYHCAIAAKEVVAKEGFEPPTRGL